MKLNKIVPFFIGSIFVIMIGSFLFRGGLIYNNFKEGKQLYEIKVPTYDGTYQSYLTESYIEENGCIKFIDEFKFEQKICNNYNVTKWN